MPNAPLQDLHVLELGTVLAIPAVGMFLAEMGATVLKVEPPAGDVTRTWYMAGEDNSRISAYFSSVNWGKQFITLDLRDPNNDTHLDRLLAWTDVLLVNFKPGDAEKFGLDEVIVRAMHPRIIYANLTGYGADNPRTGFDALVQAESGFQFLNRLPENEPTKMPVALMDLLAAHQLKEGILLALLERERTGKGSYVQVGLYQSGLAALANQAAAWLWAGAMPKPAGSDHPSIAPYGTAFQTADERLLVLAVGNDRQFASLCKVLGLRDIAQDPRFATNPARVQNRATLKSTLAYTISKHEAQDLLRELLEAQVPAGLIQNVPEALASPEAKDLLLGEPNSNRGLRTASFTLSNHPTALRLRPPQALGADNDDWLKV
jgi:crotonobetainyl-CoA:carnitine CoA-transferase CaiB-like acyl-CoA transferase